MAIQVLDQDTINKIAAGEVIERPSSVVKELVENAIDAGATAVTVEIKEGGISFIRITDNGCGIARQDLPLAFVRHSTSKIQSVEDLFHISSLGFRGEALSSIAAVAQVELITKTAEDFTGYRYVIEGGEELSIGEVGAPEGTTFIVRNLFFNTPVRRKFLKTAATEGSYVSGLLEHLALSHPDISFRFISNNQNKLHTAGNMQLKDIVYSIYGRDIAKNLIEVQAATQDIEITGFIGKPAISRGNRTYESYFINGRYIKSGIITKAIEEAYKGFIMQHNYPFTALHLRINPEILDVNVHPTKMELRFSKNEFVYQFLLRTLREALQRKELIPEVPVNAPARQGKPVETLSAPVTLMQSVNENTASLQGRQEERNVVQESQSIPKTQPTYGNGNVAEDILLEPRTQYGEPAKEPEKEPIEESAKEPIKEPAKEPYRAPDLKPLEPAVEILPQSKKTERLPEPFEVHRSVEFAQKEQKQMKEAKEQEQPVQVALFQKDLLGEKERSPYRIIGQLFDTYWLIEHEEKFYMMDQHAAHEKVLYEKTMKRMREKTMDTQVIMPAVVLSLNMLEAQIINEHGEAFANLGFEIEDFGGNAIKITGIPAGFPTIDCKQLFMDLLDGLVEDGIGGNLDIITDKIASMSCKAAIKGNHKISFSEAEALMNQLMEAENPYNCPHGRPTLIMMSKYEIEKKFHRIV